MRVDVDVRWKETPQSRDFKHMALHLSKISGLASSIAEKREHKEAIVHSMSLDFINKRLPDLVILACMIAELEGIDAAMFNKIIAERVREVEHREG